MAGFAAGCFGLKRILHNIDLEKVDSSRCFVSSWAHILVWCFYSNMAFSLVCSRVEVDSLGNKAAGMVDTVVWVDNIAGADNMDMALQKLVHENRLES